jgi:hypothetical protein
MTFPVDNAGNPVFNLHTFICTCGHPSGKHFGGKCKANRSFCNCRKVHPLFAVANDKSFYKTHTSIGLGHALIHGVLDHEDGPESIELSDYDIGKNPECYRCGFFTRLLMPVLMRVNSSWPAPDVSKGKMTRLWCESCFRREDVVYSPVVADIIEAAWHRRRGRRV